MILPWHVPKQPKALPGPVRKKPRNNVNIKNKVEAKAK